MATLQDYEKLTLLERRRRYFSESFKRKKVSEIERNIATVAEISREYQVTRTAVYQWIYKYSRHLKQGTTQVLEIKSAPRPLQALRDPVEELSKLLVQNQVEL